MNNMFRYGFSVATGVFLLLMAMAAQAGMADDISAPTVQELRFSRESIAMVFPHGVFKIKRRPGMGEPISQHRLTAEFGASHMLQPDNMPAPTGDVAGVQWALPDGSVLQSKPGYCDEGANQYLQVSLNDKHLETYLGKCDAVSTVAVVKHQLWLGSVSPAEYQDAPGSGVRVVSLTNGGLLAQFWPSKELADGLVRSIQFDPFGNDVWIATQTALHRVQRFKVVERWYWSEQFAPTGKVTYAFGNTHKESSTWAIWARATGLANENSVWKQLRSEPKLDKRLRYAYDEDGYFFNIDGVHLTLDSSKPRSWPNGFDGMRHALMAKLNRTRPSDNVAADAATHLALQQLCFFNDRRVVPFVLAWQRTHSVSGKFDWSVETCLKAQRLLGN